MKPMFPSAQRSRNVWGPAPPAWWVWGLQWGATGLASASLAYGWWVVYWGFAHHGPATYAWGRPYWVLALGLALPTWAWVLWGRWRRRRAVVLTSRGVVVYPAGRQVPWEAVQVVWRDPRWFRRRVVLTTARGRVVLGPRWPRLEAALTFIEAQLYLRRRAAYRRAWAAGRPLVFGPVSVSAQGLAYRGRLWPWSQVRGVRVEQGVLVIELPQHCVRIPVHRVPNLGLLLRWLQDEGRR